MVSKTSCGVAILAVMALVAAPVAMPSSAVAWVRHGLEFGLSEPAGLVFLGVGLIGLSQTVMRRFRKV